MEGRAVECGRSGAMKAVWPVVALPERMKQKLTRVEATLSKNE